MQSYPQSVADFDTALRIYPHSAAVLYLRDLAKARSGGDGAADFAAAVAIDPLAPNDLARHEIK